MTDPKPRKPGPQLLLTLKGKTVATAGESRDPIGADSVARSTMTHVIGRHYPLAVVLPSRRLPKWRARVWPRRPQCTRPYAACIARYDWRYH